LAARKKICSNCLNKYLNKKKGVYMEMEDLKAFGVLSAVPILGGTVANLAAKIATRFGHTFIVGSQSALLVGTIGAISNAASIVFLIMMSDEQKKSFNKLLAVHVIVPVVLSGVIAAAAYMNIIASRLSLLGTILLIGTTIIGNTAWIAGVSIFG
jgi:hypothetical protein